MRNYKGISRPDFTPERITELKADEVFVFGSNKNIKLQKNEIPITIAGRGVSRIEVQQ